MKLPGATDDTDVVDLLYWSQWHPASGHRGGWRVVRGISPVVEACGPSGRLLLFKTMQSAQARADILNKAQNAA